MAMPTDYSATIHDYFQNEFDNTLRAEAPLLVRIDNGPFRVVVGKPKTIVESRSGASG